MTGSYCKLVGQRYTRGVPLLESGIGNGREQVLVEAMEIRQSLFVEEGQENRCLMVQSTFER